MQIKVTSTNSPVVRVLAEKVKLAGAPPWLAEPAFENANALEERFSRIPDLRNDVIARAKTLANSSNYPPPKTLDRIAWLLATHYSGTLEHAANLEVGQS